MFSLSSSLAARNTPAFNDIVRREIEQLDAELLPLQNGLTSGGYVVDRPHKAMILNVTEDANRIQVKAGIFYAGVIAGCNCADDPTPVDETTEYCELLFDIDIKTGLTRVTLVDD